MVEGELWALRKDGLGLLDAIAPKIDGCYRPEDYAFITPRMAGER